MSKIKENSSVLNEELISEEFDIERNAPTDEIESDDFPEPYYIVFAGSAIVSGPPVDASDEVLKEFFEAVKKHNEEAKKEEVRVYGPKWPRA